MDQLQIKNPLTHITPIQAIHNLDRKGYFNGRYKESEHVTDPDIITLVAFRCQIATKDYNYARRIYDYPETLPALETHFPIKPVPKTMTAINHILKDQIESIGKKNLELGKKHSGHVIQLSLFDSLANKINEKLQKLERLEAISNTAMINGELSFNDYKILTHYLSQLENYYTGDLKTKPVLEDVHERELLEELKTYEIPY